MGIGIIVRQGRALMLAAVMIAAAAMPAAVYAQFGALGNMAKGKALEALNNKVMEGLEKKFAETVAKEPISEEAKAAVVKKLSEIARPIVKKFIDGAASGKPPNPAELINTVMKDILPRVPEIVAASKTEGGGAAGAVAAQSGQAYDAGQAQPVQQMQEKPKIAAYVFGAEAPEINKAMTARLTAALSNSGRYTAIDEYKDFFLQAAEMPDSGVTSLSAEQIKLIGQKFGAEYVCATEILSIMGENQISARIMSVETGAATAVAVVESPLKTLADVADASERIVTEMFKNAPPPVVAAPAPPPPPQIIAAQPEVQPNYQTNPYNAAPQQDAIENFTVGERFGTWAVNTVVPGLGSASIMRDWAGFGTLFAIDVLGSTLLGLSLANTNDALAISSIIALGAGFTYNIVRSATYRKPGSVPREKVRRIDYYFAPKYQTPVGTPVWWGGVNLEGGLVWGGGAFLGGDFNVGFDPSGKDMFGGGLSLGNVFGSDDGLQFVYGISVGIWNSNRHSDTYESMNHYYSSEEDIDFLGPFVKLRWRFMELTYRGLLGVKYTVKRAEIFEYYRDFENYRDSRYPVYRYEDSYDSGFGWNNHQLMLGFYFATSKRERAK